MNETQNWPYCLRLVHHGESAGNVARDADGMLVINTPVRDADVPLSALGERQACALGEWFTRLPPEETPTVVWVSPYVRARQTAKIALDRLLDKFYHCPPGGDSWCDVIQHLRSLVDTLARDYRGERVLLVCHSAVILCFRYLLERMDQAQILEVDQGNEVANCSVTSYVFDRERGRHGKLVLREFNFLAPLEDAGAKVTTGPNTRVGAK